MFYNLPARRKFLRSENTEARNIEHQLHLQAIGHPEIAFAFVRDERIVFQLPATKSLADRVRDLYGAEMLERLLMLVPNESATVRISGLIGEAGVSRQTRAQQLTFRERPRHRQSRAPCGIARRLPHRADEGTISGHVSLSSSSIRVPSM